MEDIQRCLGTEFNCTPPRVLMHRDKAYEYTVMLKCNDVTGFAYEIDHHHFTDTLDRIFSFLEYGGAECAEVRLHFCMINCVGANYVSPIYEIDIGFDNDNEFRRFLVQREDMHSALNVALNGFEIRALVGPRAEDGNLGAHDPRPLWAHDRLHPAQREVGLVGEPVE